MSTTDEASVVLQQAEEKIRHFLAAAAAKGNYPRVLALTEVAKKLSAMATGLDGGQPSAAAAKVAPSVRPSAGKKESEYPKFFRRGEELVKVGWSKRERREYQHRMPREMVTTIVVGMADVGAGGKRFSAESLSELTDPHGQPVPGYQIYLCLAFLRGTGLVRQEGRSNYCIEAGVDLPARSEQAWHALSEM